MVFQEQYNLNMYFHDDNNISAMQNICINKRSNNTANKNMLLINHFYPF